MYDAYLIQLDKTQPLESIHKNRIEQYRCEHTELLTEIAGRREEIQLYEENMRQLRKTKITSLKEFQQTRINIASSHAAIAVAQQKLDVMEENIREEQESLEQVQDRITYLKAQLRQFGRVYKFPT
jgi:chromosome segregation ATPase